MSHALRRLEERLGVTLVQRTTRSVSLTEAGERFYAAVRPALEELGAAVAEIGELAGEPRGLLRLHVAASAERFLAGPVLGDFLAAHPQLRLQLALGDDRPDIVASGYDAGTENGRDFSVAAEARVLCNDGAVNLGFARAGLGLAISYTDEVADDVARGTLVSVLEEFLPPFEGCYLYYPSRRRTSPALRALIDFVLAAKPR